MVWGDTTVSGAYAVNDTAGIKGYVEAVSKTITNISGMTVFSYPAANGLQVYVGLISEAFA